MFARFLPLPVLLRLAVVGLLASAAGFVGGAYLGYQAERSRFGWNCECDDHGLAGLLYGAPLGPVLLTPISVYLANRRQGSLAALLAVSAGIAAVAIAPMAITHVAIASGHAWRWTNLFFIFVIFAPPVAQTISAALIAACTSKR